MVYWMCTAEIKRFSFILKGFPPGYVCMGVVLLFLHYNLVYRKKALQRCVACAVFMHKYVRTYERELI